MRASRLLNNERNDERNKEGEKGVKECECECEKGREGVCVKEEQGGAGEEESAGKIERCGEVGEVGEELGRGKRVRVRRGRQEEWRNGTAGRAARRAPCAKGKRERGSRLERVCLAAAVAAP